MRESELVVRAKLGDREALETVIKNRYDDIYRFLARRMGDCAAAEDVNQETFLRFIDALPLYREQGKLGSFLFTLAVNACNDWYRKARPYDELDEKIAAKDIISGISEKEETALAVRRAISALPDGQKNAVLLFYYHGMRIRQIAEITNTPVATVKTRLFRAKKAMKEILEKEEAV